MWDKDVPATRAEETMLLPDSCTNTACQRHSRASMTGHILT